MTQRPPSSEPTATPPFDVGAATEALFDEILDRSNNPLLSISLNLMREESRLYRAYEEQFIPDREAEYARLLDCWRRRDKAALQRELTAYFQRRDDLAEKVAALIDRPN
jgi:hypothetical protein